MTTSFQEEQADRRKYLENEKRLREQGTTEPKSTYASFAEAFADEDRGGRFKAVNQTIHTAATPVYPEQPPNSPFHHDPVPDEPPLGFSINEAPVVGEPHEVERSIRELGDAADAPASASLPLRDVVETAAPPPPKEAA
jgi:hypothetical protein